MVSLVAHRLNDAVDEGVEIRKVIPKPEAAIAWRGDALVLAKSVLGGLHHEYSLAPQTG